MTKDSKRKANHDEVVPVKKKVLHVMSVSFALPYFVGNQFKFFKSQGIEFHVICSASDFLTDYATHMGFQAHPITISRSINPIIDVVAVYKIMKVIKQENISMVIAHTPKGGLLGMLAAYLTGTKSRIYFRHGLVYETLTGFKKILLRGIERITGKLAKKVVCVSPSIMQISNAEKLSSPLKNILLNKGTCNGVDVERFSRNAISNSEVERLKASLQIDVNDSVIGFVGRVGKDKGIEDLIEAWVQLKKQYNDIKLLLVGPFEERDSIAPALQTYIQQEPSIIHTGLIRDVSPYYAIMDIFILPSYREGFPTVVLEASAMELPVLTTRVTGCIDSIIDDETGKYILNDADDITRQLAYYLDYPEIASKHGQQGRKHMIENYAQEIVWEAIKNKVLSN